MSSSRRTQVSKSHPAIKALVAATHPEWTGRKVTVIEAGEGWTYTHYVDDHSVVALVNLETLEVARVPRPTPTTGTFVHGVAAGVALVMLARFPGAPDSIDIVVDMSESWDLDLSVAVDAALAFESRERVLEAARAALEVSTYRSAPAEYGGVMAAVAEARAKAAQAAAKKASDLENFLSVEVYA